MKKQYIDLKRYLLFQILCMMLIAFVYIYVNSFVHRACGKVYLCAIAFNCVCHENRCTCDYINENNEIKKVDCTKYLK